MNETLLYLIKANIVLSLFYLGYYCWLRKLTFYRLNRLYLLFSLLFASVYPAFHSTILIANQSSIQLNIGALLQELQASPIQNTGMTFSHWLMYLFWAGVIFFGVILLIKFVGIGKIHRKSIAARWAGYSFRKSNEPITPFAFWKNIYLNPSLHHSNELGKIFKHEYTHVQQLHTLDILIAEIALLCYWYNPIFWLYRQSIRDNIEFLTDDAVLKDGIDRKSYQYSLLQTTGYSQENPLMGSNFNLNNLKTRIMMMNKKRSSGKHIGKYALLVPTIIIGSLVLTITKADINKAASTTVEITYPAQSDTLKPGKPLPLIIVDGVKTDKMIFDQIDKNTIKSIEVIKDEHAVKKYGTEATGGVILVTTKNIKEDIKQAEPKTNIDENSPAKIIAQLDGLKAEPIIFVNGKRYIKKEYTQLHPEKIQSMNVYKGKIALEKFGKEGENGVIDIILKED